MSGNPRRKKKADKSKRIRQSTVGKLRHLADDARRLRDRRRKLRVEIDRFQDQDLPKFDRWLDEHLGKERKELDDLQDHFDAANNLYHEAWLAVDLGEYPTFAKAHAALKVEEDTRHPEDGDDLPEDGLPQPPPEMIDFMFSVFMSDVRGVEVDEMDDDAYEKARDEFASSFEHAASGNHAAFEKALLRTGVDDSDANRGVVKSLYRQLAKRLHPDHNGDLEGEEKEIWESAMASYQALDPVGLRQCEVELCLIRGEDVPPPMGEALRVFRDELSWQIGQLEEELVELRDHPAWGFSIKRSSKSLLTRIRRDIAEAIDDLKWGIDDLNREINRLCRPGKRKAKGKKQATKKRPAAKKKQMPPPDDAQMEMPF